MIIVLKPEATKKDAQEIIRRIAALGLKPLYMPGTERTVLGAIGDERVIGKLRIEKPSARGARLPGPHPLQAGQPEIHPRDHGGADRRRPAGREVFCRDRGTRAPWRVLARCISRSGGQTGRRQVPSGRSLQAADQPIQLPGAWDWRGWRFCATSPSGSRCRP